MNNKDLSWLKSKDQTEDSKPNRTPTPQIRSQKKPITVSFILDEIVKNLDPFEMTSPDEIRLRELLTAPRGNKHRNENFQRRSVIMPLLEFLIKKGWIKL